MLTEQGAGHRESIWQVAGGMELLELWGLARASETDGNSDPETGESLALLSVLWPQTRADSSLRCDLLHTEGQGKLCLLASASSFAKSSE